MVSLVHKKVRSSIKSRKHSRNIFIYKDDLKVAIILSFSFGLGWIFGLLATQDIYNNQTVKYIFDACFIITTAFHGLFIFLTQSLRSSDVKSIWNSWSVKVTGRNLFAPSSTSNKYKSSEPVKVTGFKTDTLPTNDANQRTVIPNPDAQCAADEDSSAPSILPQGDNPIVIINQSTESDENANSDS